MVNENSYLAEKIIRFGEGLRGTRQFWFRRQNELMDMIRQIGSRGMVFFTFSAADLHWPDLHNLMRDHESQSSLSEQNASKYRHQDLINNPYITAWFFEKHFKVFLEKVLIPKWNLEDWWYRFKWQNRGSTHVHGIGKRKDAPILEWKRMKEDEETMTNMVKYLDSLITTINPGLDSTVPDRHPCQKRPEELHDDLQDYIKLVNKLQRHTQCNPSYCLRVDRMGQQSCRFGYLKEIIENTYIRDDNNREPELMTARNDPLLNPHDQLQLQDWHANIDLKLILTMNSTLRYISKYASKAERRSASFSEILNKILNNSEPNNSSLSVI
jgi:ATP-dependent DNA helicase PIF1